MSIDPRDADIVVACADLVGRAGAVRFEIGYIHDDVPTEHAGWYAHAQYCGTRIIDQNESSPAAAAMGLAERILDGATCRCGQPVLVLTTDKVGCHWRLVGQRWEPGCDAPPVKIDGARGDIEAMQRSMDRHQRGEG